MQLKKLALNEAVFGREYNQGLVHQVVVAYMAGARAGTKQQKSRSDVSGGGAKPWRQKGTGRARAGTIRSPLWRSGGRTFAARPRDHSKKVNRKMYTAAMQTILSELNRKERLMIVDDFNVADKKTKSALALLKAHDLNDVLIIKSALDENSYLAVRNIPRINIIDVKAINPLDLVSAEKVVVTESAAKQIEEMFS